MKAYTFLHLHDATIHFQLLTVSSDTSLKCNIPVNLDKFSAIDVI